MLKNYIKLAFKVLLRHKFFTFVSLFGISFTLMILILTAAFLELYTGTKAPELKHERILTIPYLEFSAPEMTLAGTASYYFLNKYVKSLVTPKRISIFSENYPVVSYKDGMKIKMNLKCVDSEFWGILDFKFIDGKPFTQEDFDNMNRVVVINKSTALKYFGNEKVVGKYIEVDWKAYRICGVVENVSIIQKNTYSDIWIPITALFKINHLSEYSLNGDFSAMLLAHSKKDLKKIKAEFQKHLEQVEFQNQQFERAKGRIETKAEALIWSFFKTEGTDISVLIIFIISLMILFMLLPALNLVNINLSRIMERYSEIGVRKSFGAPIYLLVWQFIIENLILTFIGGIIGLIFSVIIISILNTSGFIPYTILRINFRIFIYALMVCIVFSMMSGVLPAFRMSRLNPVDALKGANNE